MRTIEEAIAVAEEHIAWCQRYRGHDERQANYRPSLREIAQSVGRDMRTCGKRGKAVAIAIVAAEWLRAA